MVHPGLLPRKDLREPQGALQIPPLRFATVGMTRGEGWLRLEWLRDGEKPQVPPLRFATVGMTKGEGSQAGVVAGWGETAGPSTSLRFGRDDKGRGVAQVGVVAGWGETAGPSTSLRYGRDLRFGGSFLGMIFDRAPSWPSHHAPFDCVLPWHIEPPRIGLP
jgi:hypothetical protein